MPGRSPSLGCTPAEARQLSGAGERFSMSSIDHLLVFHMLRGRQFPCFPRKRAKFLVRGPGRLWRRFQLVRPTQGWKHAQHNQIGQLPCNHCNTIPWGRKGIVRKSKRLQPNLIAAFTLYCSCFTLAILQKGLSTIQII